MLNSNKKVKWGVLRTAQINKHIIEIQGDVFYWKKINWKTKVQIIRTHL